MKKILFIICILPIFVLAENGRQIINFNSHWQFRNQEDIHNQIILPTDNNYSFSGWEKVNLPHTAKIEPLILTNQWVGVSWYKKDFEATKAWQNKKVSIEFEAVMQKADIWLNGKFLMTHLGGYLPFSVDLSPNLLYDKTNRIIVKIDNADNAEVPPGKTIETLDFCYYSGIYRNVSILVTNPLHITDAVNENIPAGGGIRVWYSKVTKQKATLNIKTHINNESDLLKDFFINCKLFDDKGRLIKSVTSEILKLHARENSAFLQNIEVENPKLWSPNHPYLYTLQVSIQNGNAIIDLSKSKIGIRKFDILNDCFYINDEPLLLIGTNRHQEYPYIGNALSDNAQYRDAVKIKKAGFNIVRLSHYPQSPAFMNACDELGILTIAAIPGWQFVGNETFMNRSFQDARDLIHRDRNHACVAFWELSLNESSMPDNFMKKMTEIAKEESPESKLITCGWINKYYDVWIPARQHAKFPNYWKTYSGKTPLFTGEYGDWEYFAQDAGLNQAGYAGLKSDERTSRQLRGDGEKRLLQQAINFQEAHNDNLRKPHLGDANWLMFDYNRGYSPDIESSGIMDIFRLPKFSYYFYSSQSKPNKTLSSTYNCPIVKIVSYWNEKTDFKNLKVFTNCDEVALYLNNKLIDRETSKKDEISDYLPYPPIIFHLKKFESGILKAIGFIDGKAVKEDIVETAGKPTIIKLSYDRSAKSLEADGNDVVFVYATVCDSKGNQVTDSETSIQFTINGNAELIGQNPIKAEAGIATILLQAGEKLKTIKVEATGENMKSGILYIKPEKSK